MPLLADRYAIMLLTDIACFALFAVSLHFIMGPAGMVSFGHAAYFGLGAYAAGLLLQARRLCRWKPRCVAGAAAAGAFAALSIGWFCVRLSGVYLAMLTLAFAQISWSIVFQWDSFTGGSNGLFGIWPSAWLARQDDLLLPDARALRRRHRGSCGACCSRPSATRCAPAAIRHCAPRRSASMCAASSGRPSCWPARRAGLAGAALPSPRAASRPRPSPSPIDRRAGHGAAGRRRDPHRTGRRCARSSPGCATRWPARPNSGAPCSARVILLIVLLFPQGLVGGLKRLTGVRREAAAHDGGAAGRAGCTRRSAACRPSRMSPSPSTPASCWR